MGSCRAVSPRGLWKTFEGLRGRPVRLRHTAYVTPPRSTPDERCCADRELHYNYRCAVCGQIELTTALFLAMYSADIVLSHRCEVKSGSTISNMWALSSLQRSSG